MEIGDVAGWVAAAVSTVAGSIAFWQARIARSQAISAREAASAAKRQADVAEEQLELEIQRDEADRSVREIAELDKRIEAVKELLAVTTAATAAVNDLLDHIDLRPGKLSALTFEKLAEVTNSMQALGDGAINALYVHPELINGVDSLRYINVRHLEFLRDVLARYQDSGLGADLGAKGKELVEWLEDMTKTLVDESLRLVEARRASQHDIGSI